MSILNNAKKMSEINIDELLQDYTLDDSIMTEVSDRLLNLNWDSLSYAERILLVLYAEYNSCRKVGNLLGFSHSSVQRFLKDIRYKLCNS